MKKQFQPLTIYIPAVQREQMNCEDLMLFFKTQGYHYYVGVAMKDDSYLSIFVHTEKQAKRVIGKMEANKQVASHFTEPCPLDEVFVELPYSKN